MRNATRMAAAGLIAASSTVAAAQKIDLLSPELKAAMAKVVVEEPTLKMDGLMPSVLFQVRNNSSYTFSMLFIECTVTSGGKMVASAEGFVAHFAPGQVAGTDAPFQMTKESVNADAATCRPSIGM